MRIAICDDTQSDLQATQNMIIDYSKKNNLPIAIDTYNDPNVLLNRLTYFGTTEYDMIVLDIIMQQNGIDVAAKIRKIDQDIIIVFATTSKEFALDAFSVRAYDYFLKPLNKDQVFERLDHIMGMFNIKVKNTISFKSIDHSIISVDIKDISYIESNDRRMLLHLNDKTILTSPSLRTKFLESIPFEYEKHNFINCHSSYIVNMNQIKAIGDYEFILKNGRTVPISKRLLSVVKDKYVKYLISD